MLARRFLPQTITTWGDALGARLSRWSPIEMAKLRRGALGRYLNLDSSRYLLIAIALLCMVSLMSLAQTGVVATKGYAISQLEISRVHLLRERSQLQSRLAQAQSLGHIRERAEQLGLRPMTRTQMRYITLDPRAMSLSSRVRNRDTTILGGSR